MGSIFNYGSQDEFHKVAFEQRLEARELSGWIRGRPLPASRNNQCQNSKAEICLAGLREYQGCRYSWVSQEEKGAAGGLQVGDMRGQMR